MYTMNMKAKRKSTPNDKQGWASPSISFEEYQSNLISIAQAIHTANQEYLSIVEEYLQWLDWSSPQTPFSSSQKRGRFSQADLRILEGVVQTQPPTSRFAVAQPSGSQFALRQLLDSLRNTSYINIWKRAAQNMAYLKKHPKHQTEEHQEEGRKRAEKFKNCRITVESGFALVEKELRVQGLDGVCDGIMAKIDMLRKYEEAYPIPPKRRMGLWFKFHTPTLLFFNLVFMLGSLIPMAIAWNRSTDAPGSTEDSDFWMLVQGAIIQSLGLISTIYTVHRKSEEHHTAWICAIWLTACGIIFAYIGIPMYLFLPTRWSGLTSFGAAVAQLGVILEIAWMADHSKLKQL
ncbi:hypothetical protein F5Y13DRAFT_129762 [Hypoxylon sp. FL1857]|nr:hypothetical protein F5Y13DRAFT_129762 [Hypoxylon sp. FL1857]